MCSLFYFTFYFTFMGVVAIFINPDIFSGGHSQKQQSQNGVESEFCK